MKFKEMAYSEKIKDYFQKKKKNILILWNSTNYHNLEEEKFQKLFVDSGRMEWPNLN